MPGFAHESPIVQRPALNEPLQSSEPSACRQQRLLILVVAYNAQSTIDWVLGRIPDTVRQFNAEVLVIDDCSSDDTYATATVSAARHRHVPITVLRNPENQGYGGNQKIGYAYAIQNGFDVVAMIHGDGQYAPELLSELVQPIWEGQAAAVFGSRMAVPRDALRGGMPRYKYVGNRVLTWFQNTLLGTRLSEFHSGYRVYATNALKQIPFELNSNDFDFDTEIIIQLHLMNLVIREVPIPTHYGDEVCHVNGLKYALQVCLATVRAVLHRMAIFYRPEFDVPNDEEPYPVKLNYRSSHTVAIDLVPRRARVLDVGCGRGFLARELSKRGCLVHGVDQPDVAEPDWFAAVSTADLNQDPLPDGLDSTDCVLMLDVIEHLDVDAQRRLLMQIRNQTGPTPVRLVLSTPNVAFLVTRLQLLLGNFNYGKRGILDLTHRHLFTRTTLLRLLDKLGFDCEQVIGIPAPFPAAIGDHGVSRALLLLNRVLIALWPTLFAYQFVVLATPRPTVSQLLQRATEASGMMRAA